jgi:hypothetical protein
MKTANEIMGAIRGIIGHHLPGAVVGCKFGPLVGRPLITIRMALKPKEEQPSQIIENDRAYHIIFIRGVNVEGELGEKVRAELVQGGTLFVNPAPESRFHYDRVKLGWRNRTATPEVILRHFDKYFERMAETVARESERLV